MIPFNTKKLTTTKIPDADTRYLDKFLFNEKHEMRVLPYEVMKVFPQEHISLFCVRNGIYQIITNELVWYVDSLLHGRSAIEIGSGNGCFGRALGIPLTDSKIQADYEMQAMYNNIGNAAVTYGHDVEKLEALYAIRKHPSTCVVGSWVTHKYIEERHALGGSVYGVDEHELLRHIDCYIIVGNRKTHDLKPIFRKPPKSFQLRTYQFPWLISRSMSRADNIIYHWERKEV